MDFNFSVDEIPCVDSKTVIVTGGGSGIGFQVSMNLAKKNCRVIIAGLEDFDVKKTVNKIIKVSGNNNVEFMTLDLSSLESIKTFVTTYKSKYSQLDILVNNAGILLAPYQLSKDGFESHFAINYLGHFYLTLSLLDYLKNSENARVVVTTSIAHEWADKKYLRVESVSQINNPKGYHPLKAYGQSKGCCIAFASQLSEKLKDMGINNVYVNAVHPGFVRTSLHKLHTKKSTNRFIEWGFDLALLLVGITVENGARTSLFAATDPRIVLNGYKGELFYPYGKLQKPAPYVTKEMGKKLWDLTIDILKEKGHETPFTPLRNMAKL